MPRTKIKPDGLPPRHQVLASGKVTYLPPSGGRHTYHDLGTKWTVRDVREAFDELLQDFNPASLKSLYDNYKGSEYYKKYAARTRKDHDRYFESLKKVFKKSDFRRATPAHIHQWLMKRASIAKEQANKELSFLRVVCAYNVQIGILKINPCEEVRKLPKTRKERRQIKEERKKSQCTKSKYEGFYDFTGSLVLRVAMELLFCMGIRIGDLLRMEWKHVTFFKDPVINDRGIMVYGYIDVDEGKIENEYRKEITPRIHAALMTARTLPGVGSMRYVLHNRRGMKYTEDGFGTIWQYWRTRFNPESDRFSIHALRRFAITAWGSTKKDKWLFSRHKTEQMVDYYDDSIPTAPSH